MIGLRSNNYVSRIIVFLTIYKWHFHCLKFSLFNFPPTIFWSLQSPHLASSNRSWGQFVFGSVNNTSLIPLLPRLTVLSCISLISSPASNQPEGYSRSLFVCFSTSLVEKWFRCGKHQARRFIFRSERLALYQIISDRALMDRVQNRSENEQGKGIDHSWNRFFYHSFACSI